jgi:hypothetical protein
MLERSVAHPLSPLMLVVELAQMMELLPLRPFLEMLLVSMVITVAMCTSLKVQLKFDGFFRVELFQHSPP